MSEMDEEAQKTEGVESEPPSGDHDATDPQAIFNANFQMDIQSFLKQPVRYVNVPNVTYDGHSFQFTFMTWTMPPGGEGLGKDNPLQVAARIAMPLEAVQILLRQIENIGLNFSQDRGLADGNDKA